MISAFIFDFDGLIVETEMPIFISWQELYARHGLELTAETWLSIIGTAYGGFDPLAELQRRSPRPHSLSADLEWRLRRETELVAVQPVLPGVVDLLQDAQRHGLKLGVASSSPRAWVEGHLQRLGLRTYFSAVLTSSDVQCTKPDPELYLRAAQALDVPPQAALAFEDSYHGMSAAHAAGLRCVVVPTSLTASSSFESADWRLETLAGVMVGRVLERFGA